MRGNFSWAIALVAGAIALSASAEVYRWTDASGVVHYTSDLQQVPPGQRDLARAAVRSGKGSLQRIGSATPPEPRASDPTPNGVGRASAPPASPAREDEVEGKTETEWRDEATRLRARVALYAPAAERCEKDRFGWSPGDGGDAYREEQAEAEQCRTTALEYELAQKSLDDFEERAHRVGVPPGWIRE